MGYPRRKGPEEQPRWEGHPGLRLHAGARPLQGAPPGRVRGSPQAAVHRMRFPCREGADPLRRCLGRPHQGVGRPRRLGQVPEAMADAAASVVRHLDGRIVYVNVMKNLSVDCDCVMHPEKPCMHDIGILSSLGRHRPGLHGSGHRVGRSRARPLHGEGQQPQRDPHDRGRRRPRHRLPRVRARGALSKHQHSGG